MSETVGVFAAMNLTQRSPLDELEALVDDMKIRDITTDTAKTMNPNEVDIHDIEFDGVDHRDAPDYCDAYITSATHGDGTALTESELDEVSDDSYFVYQSLMDYLY